MINFNGLDKLWQTAEEKTRSIGATLAMVIAAIILTIGISAIGWWMAMLLWNAIMPVIFGLPTITFWQMAGLDILLYIIIPQSSYHISKR